LCQQLSGLHIEGDRIGHEVLEKPDVIKQLIKRYGSQILDENAMVNRKILGNIVFNDTEELEFLNAVTHPIIYQFIYRILVNQVGNYNYIFIEGATLLEAGLGDLCHVILYFDALEEIRLQRLIKGRGLTMDQALKIIKAQKSMDDYKSFISQSIDTSFGDQAMLDQAVNTIRSLQKAYENK